MFFDSVLMALVQNVVQSVPYAGRMQSLKLHIACLASSMLGMAN